ncbi:MAG: NAD-dependent epimerase/dehydratase family protein [Deltaproteobacteria bacterium]|nr:NAD-dependent epimerase/dehydratase family protein [Deltaproteobacteria bacterium]
MDTWDDNDVRDAEQLAGPILIIGASGFVGANLFHSLRRIREDVFASSRNPGTSRRLRYARDEDLVCVDVTDSGSVDQALRRIRPETLFHLSAYGAYSWQADARSIHETNYIGLFNVLQTLRDIGCTAMVHAGSSSEYGLNCMRPDESSELIPNSDYAVSKVSCSFLIKYYGQVLELPCVHLRLYSVYGPWEERNRLVPTLVSSALKGQWPPLAERNISRDFVYVDDCTRAFTKAAVTICKTDPGLSVNIASGIKTTLEEVAETAKEVFALPSEPQFDSMPVRKWDLPDWYGNPRLALEKMGWQSKIGFREGLHLCARWEQGASDRLRFDEGPNKRKKISAVIACYKDEQAIPVMHQRLTDVFESSDYDYEIIFVNDGSPFGDETAIKDITAKDRHTIGISHSRNFGSQSAFLSGMEVASGDAVVLLDGDLQDPPEVIPDFIKKWEAGYNIIYGQRTNRVAPLHMRVFYKLFYRAFKLLSDIPVPVDAGDFSLMDRKAVDQMLKFPEKDAFIRGLRAWVGFRQVGIPYVRPERLFGRSTNRFLKNIWWAKKGIFSFSMKPLHLIQGLGLAMFFVSVGLSLFYLTAYFIDPPSVKGVTTVVLLVLGLGSVQLISLSVLGDYIGKITEEVKNRPRYIRRKVVFGGNEYDSVEALRRKSDRGEEAAGSGSVRAHS